MQQLHQDDAMNAITLRNLPPELARIIRRRAQESGASINKTVIALLEASLLRKTGQPRRRKYRDLSAFTGSWSRARAAEFDRSLAEQRRIDPELWK
jgi:plasmid stability protein